MGADHANNWYGNSKRTIEIVSGTALWYSTGLPAVPLRWVLIRDPQGEFETQALLCTDLAAEPEQIISWFVRRLADGGYLPGGPPAPWLRDPAAVVGKGAPENCSSAVRAVLAGDATGSPANGRGRADRPKSSLVGEGSPDILRRSGVGEKAVVGAGGETFYRSSRESDTVKVPREFMERLTNAVCYAA